MRALIRTGRGRPGFDRLLEHHPARARFATVPGFEESIVSFTTDALRTSGIEEIGRPVRPGIDSRRAHAGRAACESRARPWHRSVRPVGTRAARAPGPGGGASVRLAFFGRGGPGRAVQSLAQRSQDSKSGPYSGSTRTRSPPNTRASSPGTTRRSISRPPPRCWDTWPHAFRRGSLWSRAQQVGPLERPRPGAWSKKARARSFSGRISRSVCTSSTAWSIAPRGFLEAAPTTLSSKRRITPGSGDGTRPGHRHRACRPPAHRALGPSGAPCPSTRAGGKGLPSRPGSTRPPTRCCWSTARARVTVLRRAPSPPRGG